MANNRCLLMGLWLVSAASCGQRQQDDHEKSQDKATAQKPTATAGQADTTAMTANMELGKLVYDQYCATCHQSNGLGVPNLNPPLAHTDYVTGDKERLIRIVLNGSNDGLEVNGMVYSNAMPANAFLSDEEIAGVLSYIRKSFGNRADTISAAEVSRVRALSD
ncbi:c-type cytochrome [Parapedobacter deserti]|uniref:c-type cytochrome n=1 Tax=Parapedobacter deserti TaxID=1912957 RepID=UPI00366E8CED